VTKWERGVEVDLVTNKDYFKGASKLDGIKFMIVPDQDTQRMMFETNQVDVFNFEYAPAQLSYFLDKPEYADKIVSGLRAGTYYYLFNESIPPLDNPKVRQALFMAIDRQGILDAIFGGKGNVVNGFVPEGVLGHNPNLPEIKYDPDAAKALLAEAGYPNGFTTDLWAMPVQRPYNPNAKRIAELMQADLAKIGVKAEIKSFEWGEYRKRMQAGEHQMGMLGWTGDNGDPDNFLNTLLGCESAKTNGSNVAKFCYKPYEDLILKAKVVSSQAERAKLYEKAQVIFKEQAPWFTIAHAVQLKPVRKEVVDFKLSPFGRHNFYGVDIKQ